jgi:hypothetical protein
MMLPDTEPQAHLYLGALFEERTLADEHGLLRYFPSEQGRQDDPEEAGRDRGDSVDEAEGELSPDYDGIRQLFLRGVLTPDCDLNPRAEDDCPRYKASQGGLGDMARELLEPLAGSLESDYAP